MATIYRKTDKGQSEIETRQFRLLPRLRTALILVDGRRTEDELAKLIPADPQSTIATLLSEGFIEVYSVLDPRGGRLAVDIPVQAEPPAAPSTLPPPVARPPRAPVDAVRSFEGHRRDAIKAFTDHLGPMAEAMALRMEKCTNWNQLLPMLQMAQQILRSSRGASAAEEYGARFIDPLSR